MNQAKQKNPEKASIGKTSFMQKMQKKVKHLRDMTDKYFENKMSRFQPGPSTVKTNRDSEFVMFTKILHTIIRNTKIIQTTSVNNSCCYGNSQKL